MLSHNIFYSVPFVFCIISMETGFGLPFFYLQHKQNAEIQMHSFSSQQQHFRDTMRQQSGVVKINVKHFYL